MKHITSCDTYIFRNYGSLKEIIKLMKDSGFEGYDFSFFGGIKDICDDGDYVSAAKELRKYADEIGIVCVQAHAPFPIILETEEKTEERRQEIIKTIEAAAILGAKNIVIHPCNNYNAQQNKKYYDTLVPYLAKNNIRCAVENMFNWDGVEKHALPAACSSPEDFFEHISLLDDRYFTCCVDIGHCEMFNKNYMVPILEKLNKKVGCLHIHDNDQRNDCHAMPFSMQIDFDVMIEALRKIDYQGATNLEVIHGPFDESKAGIEQCCKKAADVAKQLKNMLEKRA